MMTDATVLPEEDESLEPAPSSVKAIVGSTLTFIAMVVLWEVLVVQLKIPGWMLPSPSAIADAMIDWRSERVRGNGHAEAGGDEPDEPEREDERDEDLQDPAPVGPEHHDEQHHHDRRHDHVRPEERGLA